MKKPAEIYAEIRAKNPDPIGDHWQGIGCYLGDDTWGDPDHFGQTGDYERLYQATRRHKRNGH